MENHGKLITLLLCATLFGGCYSGATVVPDTLKNSIGMIMVRMPSGYYVSKYETRQSEFEAVMGYNPSRFLGKNHPVEKVTATEADEFCRRLTQLEQEKGTLPEGYIYDLPTFTQWKQYVADASLDKAIVPKEIGKNQYAEFDSHQPVGSGDVNRLGLYDLRGNVKEYSRDVYRSYYSRIVLGASWNTYRTDHQRKDNRGGIVDISKKSFDIGFRCVLIPANTR